VNEQDEGDVVEDAESSLEGNGESKDKKSFNFTGDVLYSVCAATAEDNTVFSLNVVQGDGRRFFKQATLNGLSETISIGDVCWCVCLPVVSDLNIYWFVHRLMSDNPLRPYIGRIIAMWQDKAGLHHQSEPFCNV
jgi:hypothetical protein